jgi:alpha-ketoglutarate-dependent taurine dioxygenase
VSYTIGLDDASQASVLAQMRWTRDAMASCSSWRIGAPRGIEADAAALNEWAGGRTNPVADLQKETLYLPAVRHLGSAIGRELDEGTGVALVHGLPPLTELHIRLLYLAIGMHLGDPIGPYGRLYDVKDTGQSYREKAIPVSQTKEATGMHTDSSHKDVCPRIIGLACVRPALAGGMSRIASAVEAHERLREQEPGLLARLYDPFVRDLVTPGAARSPKTVAQNAFPVFKRGARLSFRYMRFWIERGHQVAGVPLEPADLRAFDVLDRELNTEANVLSFRMGAGEMLFIDNTTTCHDRDAFQDDPVSPRLMLRLWLDRPSHALTPASADRVPYGDTSDTRTPAA